MLACLQATSPAPYSPDECHARAQEAARRLQSSPWQLWQQCQAQLPPADSPQGAAAARAAEVAHSLQVSLPDGHCVQHIAQLDAAAAAAESLSEPETLVNEQP